MVMFPPLLLQIQGKSSFMTIKWLPSFIWLETIQTVEGLPMGIRSLSAENGGHTFCTKNLIVTQDNISYGQKLQKLCGFLKAQGLEVDWALDKSHHLTSLLVDQEVVHQS